jgi:hypothetical protein
MAGATVPLWVQLATVSFSPILGLMGVAYGARSSRSNKDKEWLRETRRQAYAQWMKTYHDALWLFRVRVPAALDRGDDDLLRGEYSDHVKELLDSANLIQGDMLVFASPDLLVKAEMAFNAFRECFDLFHSYEHGHDLESYEIIEAANGLLAATNGVTLIIRTELLSVRRLRLFPFRR